MPAFVALARNAVLSANLRPHVQPVDDKADVKTAEVISALIRNTEHLSQVEAVYSTAIDSMSEKWPGLRPGRDGVHATTRASSSARGSSAS